MDYNNIFTLKDLFYYCEETFVWKKEKWKYISGYRKKYMVSDLGRIKSMSYHRGSNQKILKTNNASFGYKNVCLSINSIRRTHAVHILVAVAFLSHVPGGYDLVVNHKNFKPYDNVLSNLELVSQRENANLKHKKSTSIYVGVCWNIGHQKWQSRIVIKRKRKHLGYFFNELDAHKAYQDALKNLLKN